MFIMNKNDEIPPQPPPIPPRRKKRKKLSATVVSEPTSKTSLNPSSKSRQKSRLPPPPPPPVQKTHEKISQFVNNFQHTQKPESDPANISRAEVTFEIGEDNRNSEVRQYFQNENQNHFQNRNVYTYPPHHREPNKYPPLLFTFQDFQTVMAESISNRNYQTSLDETFSSNNLIDESKVCFRVTTTNLPFEKCLGTWQNSFDNPEFVASDESSFIFEDYIDRSKPTAGPDLFRIESLENSLEDLVPNRTKVRFIIESPSTSIPDEDAEITMDSLQNIESLNKDLEELQKIQSICEAIQNAEGDLPFDSMLCNSDELNLVQVVSETDLMCENVVKNDKKKETEEDIESSSTEIIFCDEKGTPEKSVPKISANPKLQRYKTCTNADHFTADIREIEKPEENLEQVKEASYISKLHKFKIQTSGSVSYEDAFDSGELILKVESYDNQNISVKNQEVQAIKESSEKKKILIDSSLCDFINSETKWNESSDEKRETFLAKESFESEIKIDPCPQVSSIPVIVRRKSFSDKMLNEEACEVVVTHSKPDELESPPQEFLTLSTSSERKVARSTKMDDVKMNENQKGKVLKEDKVLKKSVGEAKGDVLNELLCNFSTLKLKSVANSKIVHRDPSANHVKLPNESVCEQTDELRVKEDGSISARVTNPNEALASIEDQLISVDKCAIARRSSKTCNNSINNKAKTPVAISNDQSHDTFTITPGSVRNFIKHYEIQRETINQCFKAKDVKDKYVKGADDKVKENNDMEGNKYCKDNDDVKIVRKLSKEDIETLELKKGTDGYSLIDLKNVEENDSIHLSKSLRFIENLKKELEFFCESLPTSNGSEGRRQSCFQINDSSTISERKNSVQFDSACTVIQLQKQEESSMTSLINGIRYKIKRKAPNKPEEPIKFKTSLRSDDSTPDMQKESEAQRIGNTSKSGTDHLVPKTENPLQSETFVFYCKVVVLILEAEFLFSEVELLVLEVGLLMATVSLCSNVYMGDLEDSCNSSFH